MWPVKAWTAIDRLSIIWKSNQSDKIKHIFPNSGRVNSTIWMHNMDAYQAYLEKFRRELQKNTTSYIEQIL